MRPDWLLMLALFGVTCGPAVRGADLPVTKDSNGLFTFTHARYCAAPGHEKALVGGRFQGSNRSATDGFSTLAEITEAPANGQWGELTFANDKAYRWLRYEGPAGSNGRVAELEFYAGSRKLPGKFYGPSGETPGHGWRNAIDGKVATWFESDTPDRQAITLDLREQAAPHAPVLEPRPGDYGVSQVVTVKSPTAGASIRYTTDGTLPDAKSGTLYTGPVSLDGTVTLAAVAVQDDLAPSLPALGTYRIGTAVQPGLHSLHVGNSLTNTTYQLAQFARTAGYAHVYESFTGPGAWTKGLWDDLIPKQKARWEKVLDDAGTIDHFTVQPRDFNIAEEASYDLKFFDVVRQRSPNVQPWFYCEWTERARQRPTDKGAVASSQMQTIYPALTWEESMSAMLLYMEELQREVLQTDKGNKRPRVLPSALAMGWIKNMIDHDKLPGAAPGSFYPLLFNDSVHPNENGGYLVDLTWFSAFYRKSPVGMVLPIGTELTAEQAALMQRLAWDVVENYPNCGLYTEGTAPVGKPAFSPAAAAIDVTTPVTLSSSTPGAWFRYTLDGTPPTRTRGYVYCGVISLRPGMTVKAVAYKSGMADSEIVEETYAAR